MYLALCTCRVCCCSRLDLGVFAMALKKVSSLRSSLVPRATVAAASAALLMAAFTSASSSDSGGNPSSQNLTGRGPITYVEGKDTTETGAVKQLIERWNASHPDEQVTFKEQSNDASQQYDDLVEHMRS